jgi:F-box protein 9
MRWHNVRGYGKYCVFDYHREYYDFLIDSIPKQHDSRLIQIIASMSPREHALTLPVIPENSEATPRWENEEEDADVEDSEEQVLFEQDNNNGVEGDFAICDGLATNEGGVNNSHEDVDSAPLYVQSSSGDSWELTWPIWHMLPRNERRAIATKHGMKSIGEFEEYMILTRAVDDSGGAEGGNSNNQVQTLKDDGSDSVLAAASLNSPTTNWYPPFIGKVGEDDDVDESDSTVEDASPAAESSHASEDTRSMDLEDNLEMIRLGGLPCSLPDEILQKVFSFLPIDDVATLALVSPHWSRFTRCESLYKTLCQRIYLNQSKRKTLHVARFGNSYRNMLEMRPRVRAGGGLYVLKYQQVIKYERDMFTEIPAGAILESVYYRYLYFFEDGRVLYALTHATPLEMIPRFSRMLLHGDGSKDKWGVWGRYQIAKDVVRVWVSHSWSEVVFQLRVIPSNRVLHYDSGDRGACTTLALDMHLSSVSGSFDDDSQDLVKYEIPSHAYFRFLRDRRL